MKIRTKQLIHNMNKGLNQPIAVVIVLLLLFAFFAYGNAQFQKDNRILLKNTKQSVDNSQTIIKNLEQGIVDLKDDNQRQTRFIQCLLALQKANIVIDSSVQAQCTKMASHVDISDVTRSGGQSSQGSSTTNNSTTNNTTNNNAATPPPDQEGAVRNIINGLLGR